MAAAWLKIGSFVLSNLDAIINVVMPVFTRKNVDAIPNQAELLNQQISELQGVSLSNSELIKELAAQLKQVVAALDEATVAASAERAKTQNLFRLSVCLSVISIIVAILLSLSR